MSVQMSKNFVLPTGLEPYEGFGDLRVHIKKFQSMMFFNGASDPVLYRSFPTYLDGATLLWFSKIPAGSISSFEDLARSFIDYFTASRIYVHGSDYLNTIKQGQHESLKDYMTRFAKAIVEIPDLDPKVHLHALKSGLRPRKFQETIAVTKPKTLDEFCEKAAGQMKIEEFIEARRAERPPPRREDEKYLKTPNHKDTKKPFKLTPKYDAYTQFNTKRENIIKEILNAKIIKPPSRAGSYQDQRYIDKTKHCAFHQKFGHTTDECVIAKDLLERLAKQGHLDKYISGQIKQTQTQTNTDHQSEGDHHATEKTRPQPPRTRGIINCISGGFAGGGNTNSAQKRSYRAMLAVQRTEKTTTKQPATPTIPFDQNDHKPKTTNLDDPVVISIQTGDLLVRKVPLNPGSSTDVLFYSTFQKMKLSANIRQPSSGELANDDKTATVYSDQSQARRCYNESLKIKTAGNTETGQQKETLQVLNISRPPTLTLVRTCITDLHQPMTSRRTRSKLYLPQATDRSQGLTYSTKEAKHGKRKKDGLPTRNPEALRRRLHQRATLHNLAIQCCNGYNQILMHPKDQDKIAFITEMGNYCYKVMPFGLKNACATYQRLMDKIFNKQTGQNLEVYVDDMVIKTKQLEDHGRDIEEIFTQLGKHNMRLNLEKCAFRVKGGKFLGFMLTSRGIKANPEKCDTIIKMRSPPTVKEVQQLNGRLAALSRFLPAISTHSQHFFSILRKERRIQWDAECKATFQKLKLILSSPPILQKPEPGKPLLIYLSISTNAISSVLVTEIGRHQHPVYFVSKTLQNAELRYPPMKKLAYALIVTARRLRHYFQSNPIVVKTSQPICQVLSRSKVSGRLTKCLIELSEFDITYEPRTAMKAQFLADFVAELAEQIEEDYTWELYVDGASNSKGFGAGVLLTNKHDLHTEQSIRFTFKASNNQAEYETLLTGLRLAQSLNITHLQVYCNSQLVVQQVTRQFQVKDHLLEKYYSIVKDLMSQFHLMEITHIAREQNTRADALSKLATTRKNKQESVIFQLTIAELSFSNNSIFSISQESDWRTPCKRYLQIGDIPEGLTDLRIFKKIASSYSLIGHNLYKRGFSQSLLRCIDKEEANIIMDEAHEGVCGNHVGGMSLASKITIVGYYWPTLK
ncbi:uncharacterized protein [Arachis hypogaea]|uniref:uncharacterized protein n=1 Tax=Arachis hypogaea TaxID=3818 RepID=UPI003B20D8E5